MHRRSRTEPRRSPVALACALLALGAGGVQAQSADAPTQTITVTGIRHAIESSVTTKREATSIVEAISAEDIGKLPDISIAESLSRLPGLAAQRVDGRAQVIAIRGMSPDFAGTLLNGREQTTTGVNRGVEFDQYPAELMGSAVVYKTPDATLLGQGLSGTVDLRALRPLDVGQRSVALGARLERNSNGDLNHGYGGTGDQGGRFSASYVDQFNGRTVGIALGFAHLDAPGQQLHYKAWGFQDDSNCLAHQADWGCSPVSGLPAGANYLNGFEVTAVSRREKRDGLMGVLEYKPNADLHSTVDLYYSKFDQTEVMRGLMGSIGDNWGGATGSTFSNVKTTDIGGIPLVTSATTAGGPPLIVRNDYNTRSDKLSSLGWNTEAKLGTWKAIADISYSNAKRDETLYETYAGTGVPLGAMAFNIPTGTGFPTFSPTDNFGNASVVALSDPGGWGHDGRKQNSKLDDTIKALNLHGKTELEGFINRIDAGVNFSQRDKQRDFLVWFAALSGGGTRQLIDPAMALTPTSLGFAGIPGVLSYDVNAVSNRYYTLTQNMSGGPTGDFSRDYGVHERITTAYVKGDIGTELGGVPITGNVGLQLIHTRQYSNANAFDSNGNPAGTITPGTTYNDVLPSLNLTADIGGNRLLRLGLARTLARPRMDDLNASSSASVDTQTKLWSGSGGNPKLLPWRANSVDLSLEQYLGKRSYVAGAVFYKQLVSYIYQQTIPFDFTGYVNGNPNPVQPVTNIGQYSTQANGQGGSMRGLELSAALDGALLSPSLDGFGLQASLSVTGSSIKVNGPADGKTPIWASLPGLSTRVAGLTLYYEKDGFSARVADRYRSDYRGEYASLFGATSVYRTPAQNQVDLQLGYEIQQGSAKGLSLLFQVVNATNAADRTLQDGSGFGGVVAPQENNVYGRSYLLGVNWKL